MFACLAYMSPPRPCACVFFPQTSSFAKLRFDLPAMIHEGLAHTPSFPRLPSVKTLARVRSLDDLKRELNAGFSSSVGGIKQGKSSAANMFQSKIDARGKGALKTTVDAEKAVVALSVGEQPPPPTRLAAASSKSAALTGLSPPPASSDAPVVDATAESVSPAVVARERQGEGAIQGSSAKYKAKPGSDNISVDMHGSSSAEAAAAAVRGGGHEASTTPRPSAATTPRTPPPQAKEATAAAGLKREQGHTVSHERDEETLDKEPPSPNRPASVSEEPTPAPKSTAISRGPAMNVAEKVQTMHDGIRDGQDKPGRADALSGSVALAAVGSLDEQVRGLGVRIWRRVTAGVYITSCFSGSSLG